MNEEDIPQGMSEIFFYNCSKYGQGNLSRDEVFATKSGTYLCPKCHCETPTDICPCSDCKERRLKSNEVDKEGK